MSKQTVLDAIKQNANELSLGAPPVTVTGLSIFGIGLQDWVYILTIAYTIFSILWLAYKAVVFHRKGKPDGSN